MLKKTLKKVLAVALTVAAVATTLAVPVSASTLKPKKSHKDSEVQERVLYLIDAADEIAFSPWKKAPGAMGGTYDDRHDNHSYRAYKMCELLLATPNLKSACSSETIAELKQARSTWKKAYITNNMYLYYLEVWNETEYLTYDNVLAPYKDSKGKSYPAEINYNKVSKKATSSYNRVKKYIDKYKKYNPEFASYLATYNKKQYQGYKDYVKVLKGLTPAKINKIVKRWGTGAFAESVADTYHCFSKYGTYLGVQCDAVDTLCSKISTWYWNDMGMTPFNGDKNSPHKVFMRNTRYAEW